MVKPEILYILFIIYYIITIISNNIIIRGWVWKNGGRYCSENKG